MIANYHTHTWRCNHAVGTEKEYVENGINRGLHILGFSDHTPYPFPNGYQSTFRMRQDQLDGYVEAIQDLQKTYRGTIDIHLGLEAEYYPLYFKELISMLRDRPIEYLLLGQHFLGNEIGDVYSGKPTSDPIVLARYCHQSMEAMNTGLFTYFAHPDLLNFQGSPKLYDHWMRQLCKEAKSCQMPLEINLLGLRDGRHYPNDQFWTIAGEEGCDVILGCDAHEPEALWDLQTEKKAIERAQKAGIWFKQTVSLRSIR